MPAASELHSGRTGLSELLRVQESETPYQRSSAQYTWEARDSAVLTMLRNSLVQVRELICCCVCGTLRRPLLKVCCHCQDLHPEQPSAYQKQIRDVREGMFFDLLCQASRAQLCSARSSLY